MFVLEPSLTEVEDRQRSEAIAEPLEEAAPAEVVGEALGRDPF